MYEYLEGTIQAREPGLLVLEVGGVGYALVTPLMAEVGQAGDDVRLWTHFLVREDVQRLYGFSDRPTREIFRILIGVRGVGPGVALAILSGLGSSELLTAIVNSSVATLTSVKGVGKKTAEQILLDLREKAPLLREALSPDQLPRPTSATPSGVAEDAVQALISIGYNEKDARRGVEKASQEVPVDDLDALLRHALRK